MKHVPPHRWADLAAGRVPEAERAALEAHAEECPACARTRARVAGVRAVLGKLADAPPPALSWDLLGTRLYWSASSEMRRRERERDGRRSLIRRIAPFALAGLLLGSGVAAVLLASRRLGPAPTPHAPVLAVVPPTAPPAPAPPEAPALAVAPLGSVVTLLAGDVTVGAAKASEATTLHPGDVVKTGRGRFAVQFGERSALVVEPDSRLEVVAWDTANVVLRVTGAVTVELEKRQAGQRFAVLAGERAVEVRGTIFRVAEHRGDVDVAVTRGKVAVLSGEESVEVVAPARLALAASASIGSLLPRPLLAEAGQQLADGMRAPILSGWKSADELRSATAMLSITAPARAAVAVDGRPVGTGAFLLRTTPGRHLVETAGLARWIDVEVGVAATVAFGDRTRSERPGQVDDQLLTHRVAVGQCAVGLRNKEPGFTGEMTVEIGINGDGSVYFVAPVRPFPDRAVESCVMDVIRDRFTFPSGSKATVQKVIRF